MTASAIVAIVAGSGVILVALLLAASAVRVLEEIRDAVKAGTADGGGQHRLQLRLHWRDQQLRGGPVGERAYTDPDPDPHGAHRGSRGGGLSVSCARCNERHDHLQWYIWRGSRVRMCDPCRLEVYEEELRKEAGG